MQLTKILVPCDLKEESYVATHHAAYIAELAGAEIALFHIETDENKSMIAEQSLQSWAYRLSKTFSGKITTHVRSGRLAGEIPAFASEHGCGLVVMPTHGMRGMQKILGSKALRVITESSTPFIVVQERSIRAHGYKKLVIPVDYRHQILEECNAFVQLAELFKGEVHLVIKRTNTELMNTKIIEGVQQVFEKASVSVHMHEVTHSGHFAKELIRYAAGIEADLICAINFSYEYLYTLIPRAEEEDLIYNDAQIPVLLVTPKDQDLVIYNIPMRF